MEPLGFISISSGGAQALGVKDMVLIVPSGKKALNKIGSRLRLEQAQVRRTLALLAPGADRPQSTLLPANLATSWLETCTCNP